MNSRKKLNITEEKARKILNSVQIYFEHNPVNLFATYIEMWDLIVTGEEGERTYRGSLCSSFEVEEVDLSDLIRDILGIENLFVFDGKDYNG